MSNIVVDTKKLLSYAQRLQKVNSRISNLDRRLDNLYLKVGIKGIYDLMKADALTGYSWRLYRCQSYLQQTAWDFERAERDIIYGVNIPDITNYYSGNFYGNSQSFWDYVKKKFSNLPRDISYMRELITFIELEYGGLSIEIRQAVRVLVPSSLEDSYNLVTGLIQKNLTAEEAWDTVKHIIDSDITALAVFETFEYVFAGNGKIRSEELEREFTKQLLELDIMGAGIDATEGFVDGILCGVVEVLGDVGGHYVDEAIDDSKFLKAINKYIEYSTGVNGWNDGEGYSIGDFVGHAAEKVSEGIDGFTDTITDATDVVTSAITSEFKSSVAWFVGIFD